MISDPKVIRAILECLGLPSEPPVLAQGPITGFMLTIRSAQFRAQVIHPTIVHGWEFIEVLHRPGGVNALMADILL